MLKTKKMNGLKVRKQDMKCLTVLDIEQKKVAKWNKYSPEHPVA